MEGILQGTGAAVAGLWVMSCALWPTWWVSLTLRSSLGLGSHLIRIFCFCWCTFFQFGGHCLGGKQAPSWSYVEICCSQRYHFIALPRLLLSSFPPGIRFSLSHPSPSSQAWGLRSSFGGCARHYCIWYWLGAWDMSQEDEIWTCPGPSASYLQKPANTRGAADRVFLLPGLLW